MLNISFIGANALNTAYSQMSDVGQKSKFIYSEDKNLNISLESVSTIKNPFKVLLSNGLNCNPSESDFLIGIQRHRLKANIDNKKVLFLGKLKSDLSSIELYSRNATAVEIDLNVLKKSEIPQCPNAKPSGLSSEEFAQIARYIGFSSNIDSITITSIEQEILLTESVIEILAEFIWYLSEGYKNRIAEDPRNKEFASVQYLQHNDFSESILIYKSKKSQRCWVTIEGNENLHPCSIEEYKALTNNEIPQRLWNLLVI